MTSSASHPEVPGSPLVPALARGIDDAGYAVFRAAANDTDNTLISPVSIGIAFGMAQAGASGRLAQAIPEAFDLPGEGEQRLEAFRAYEARLSVEPGTTVEDAVGDSVELPTVTLANRVFTDQAFEPRQEYVDTVETWFHGGAEAVPLRTDAGAAAERINAWVSKSTSGQVTDLISPAALAEDSRLVLVNALHMRGAWRDVLDQELTQQQPFTRLDGSEVQAPMMAASETASGVAERPDLVAASLAYAGDSLEMIVIVPDEGAFEQVRGRLDTGLLEEIDASWLDAAPVVRLPRFDASSRVDLGPLLETAVGVEGLFDTPGLDGIGDDLWIGGALHATRIVVDETGTEASAATSVMVEAGSAETDWVEVTADRPFLYVIRDVDTGAALMVGQVLDPTA